MLFNSYSFLFFFLAIWLTEKWLNKIPVLRNIMLLLSGWAFYALWSWEFLILLLYISMVTFIAADFIGHFRELVSYDHRTRHRRKEMAYAMIQSGIDNAARKAVKTYGRAWPQNKIYKLLQLWAKNAVTWKMLCMALRQREELRKI